jgi:hypothetical protein
MLSALKRSRIVYGVIAYAATLVLLQLPGSGVSDPHGLAIIASIVAMLVANRIRMREQQGTE